MFYLKPGGCLIGEIFLSGDKSISHRALLLAAIAEGETILHNFLQANDCLATLQVLRNLGVKIFVDDQCMRIHGVGLRGLQATNKKLDLGNAGTAMRLMMGLLSAQHFSSELVGDESLSKRPMRRVAEPLRQMGAHIELTANEFAPLKIFPVEKLKAINYSLPVASAQVKSAVLLAALYAEGETIIHEPEITRDHTERLLRSFSANIVRENNAIKLMGQQTLHATEIHIPNDLSAAAFFMVGASIASGSEILLKNVGINPARIGVINILKAMGADISLVNQQEHLAEPIADIYVRSSRLKGITVPASWVSTAIDEFPAIFVAAACAEGETIVQGAGELRVKETDRLQVMATALQALDIKANVTADGICIAGGKIKGGVVDSCGDHRVAMALAIAALVAREEIVIANTENVATSFPDFQKVSQQLGLRWGI